MPEGNRKLSISIEVLLKKEEFQKGLKEIITQVQSIQKQLEKISMPSKREKAGLLPIEKAQKELESLGFGLEVERTIVQAKNKRRELEKKLREELEKINEKIYGKKGSFSVLAYDIAREGPPRGKFIDTQERYLTELKKYKETVNKIVQGEGVEALKASQEFQKAKNRLISAYKEKEFWKKAYETASQILGEGFIPEEEVKNLAKAYASEITKSKGSLAEARRKLLEQYIRAIQKGKTPEYLKNLEGDIKKYIEVLQKFKTDFETASKTPIAEGGLKGKITSPEEVKQLIKNIIPLGKDLEKAQEKLIGYTTALYKGLIPQKTIKEIDKLIELGERALEPLRRIYKAFTKSVVTSPVEFGRAEIDIETFKKALEEATVIKKVETSPPKTVSKPKKAKVEVERAKEEVEEAKVEVEVEEAKEEVREVKEEVKEVEDVVKEAKEEVKGTQEEIQKIETTPIQETTQEFQKMAETIDKVDKEAEEGRKEIERLLEESAKQPEPTITSTTQQTISHLQNQAQILKDIYQAQEKNIEPAQYLAQLYQISLEKAQEIVKALQDQGVVLQNLTKDPLKNLGIISENLAIVREQIKSGRISPELIGVNLGQLSKQIYDFASSFSLEGKIPKKTLKELQNLAIYLPSYELFLSKEGSTPEDIDSVVLVLDQLAQKLNSLTPKVKEATSNLRAFLDSNKDIYRVTKQLSFAGTSLMFVFGGISVGIWRLIKDLGNYALQTAWYAERLGLTTQEVQALSRAIEYSGTTMQQYATSMAVLSRKMMDALRGSGVAVQAIKALNLEIIDSEGNINNFQEMLGQIFYRLQEIRQKYGQEANMIISGILTKLFGREQTKLALFLAEDLQKITERFRKMKLMGVVFSDEDQRTARQMQEAFLDLTNALKGFLYALIIGASGPLLKLFTFLRDFIVSLKVIFESFKVITGPIFALIAVVVKLGVFLGVATFAISRVNYAITALRNIVLSTVASISPLTLIITGLITVFSLLLPKITGVDKAFEEAKKGGGEFFKDFQKVFSQLTESAREEGYDFGKAYAEGMEMSKPLLRRTAISLAYEIFKYFGGGHSPALIGPLANMEAWGAELINAYIEGAQLQINRISQYLEGIGSRIKQFFQDLSYKIGYNLGGALFGKPINFRDYYLSILEEVKREILGLISTVKSVFININTSFWNTLFEYIEQKTQIKDKKDLFSNFLRGFLDGVKTELISLTSSGFSIIIDTIYGFIGDFIGKYQTEEQYQRLTNWLAQVINMGTAQHAEGTITTKPHLAVVGEEGPEAIIPLSPSRRKRGLELWIKAGQALGVIPYAEGGIAGVLGTNTVTVQNLEDWVKALGDLLTKATGNFLTGIIEAIARWEQAIKTLPEKVEPIRKFEFTELQKQTKILETINVRFWNVVKVWDLIANRMSSILTYLQSQTRTLNNLTIKGIESTVKVVDIGIASVVDEFKEKGKLDTLIGVLKTQAGKNAIEVNWGSIINTIRSQFPPQEVPPAVKEFEEAQTAKIKLQALDEVITEISNLIQSKQFKGVGDIIQIITSKTEKKDKATADFLLSLTKINWAPVAGVLSALQSAGKPPKIDDLKKLIYETVDVTPLLKEINEGVRALNQMRTYAQEIQKEIKQVASTSSLQTTKNEQTQKSYKVPPELQEIFLRIYNAPLGVYWKEKQKTPYRDTFLGWFEENSQFTNLINQVNNYISQLDSLKKEFAQGGISTYEFYKKIENLRENLRSTNKTLDGLLAKTDIKGLQEWLLQLKKLQDEISTMRGLTTTEIESKVKEAGGGGLLAKIGTIQGKEAQEVLQALSDVISEEISGIEAVLELINNTQEKIGNTIVDKINEANESIKDIASPDEIMNLFQESIFQWIQGDFQGALSGLMSYIKQSFLQGLFDYYKATYSNQINVFVEGLRKIRVGFLGLFLSPKEGGSTIIQGLKETGRSLLEMNQGAFKSMGKFMEDILNLTQSPALKTLYNPNAWLDSIRKIFGGNVPIEAPTMQPQPEPPEGLSTVVKVVARFLQGGTEVWKFAFKEFWNSSITSTEYLKKLGAQLNLTGKEIEMLSKGTKILGKDLIWWRDKLLEVRDKIVGFWDRFKETPVGKATVQVGQQLMGAFGGLFSGIMATPLGGFLGGFASDALMAVLSDFVGMFQDIYEGFLKDFVQLLKEVVKPVIIPIIQLLANVLKIFMAIIKPFLPLLKFLMELLGAIIELVAKFILLYWNYYVKPVLYGFIKAIAWILKAIGYVIDLLLGWATDWGKKLMATADAMSQSADEMYKESGEAQNVEQAGKKDQPISIANLTGTALDEFTKLLSPLKSLNLLPSYAQQMVEYLKQIAESLGSVPKLANGGIVTAPTLAWLGENGPEIVSPLGKSIGRGEIVINNLNVYVEQATDLDIEEIVNEVLKSSGIRARRINYARGG